MEKRHGNPWGIAIIHVLVVHRVDNASFWINLYLVNTYPLDSGLSVGYRCPIFGKPGPGIHMYIC